jgi:hypothetical protein
MVIRFRTEKWEELGIGKQLEWPSAWRWKPYRSGPFFVQENAVTAALALFKLKACSGNWAVLNEEWTGLIMFPQPSGSLALYQSSHHMASVLRSFERGMEQTPPPRAWPLQLIARIKLLPLIHSRPDY